MADRKRTGDPAQEPDLKQDESAAGALIAPHSIAIVGASGRSRWSTAIVGNLECHGFAGDLHLVNPRGGSIGGRPVAQSCAAVGAEIDLGIILVPANAAICRRVTLSREPERASRVYTQFASQPRGSRYEPASGPEARAPALTHGPLRLRGRTQ